MNILNEIYSLALGAGFVHRHIDPVPGPRDKGAVHAGSADPDNKPHPHQLGGTGKPGRHPGEPKHDMSTKPTQLKWVALNHGKVTV